MDLTGSLRARSSTGKKGTHKASFQQPNRDYLMITLFFHYIIPNRKTKKQTTALLDTGFKVKLARKSWMGSKHSQGLFPAAESRLPDDNIILSLYYSKPQDKEADGCTLRHWI
jgi:hypothetical protein